MTSTGPLFVVRLFHFDGATERVAGGFNDLGAARVRAESEARTIGIEAPLELEDDGVYQTRGEDIWVSITTHERPPVSPPIDRHEYVHCAAREDESRRLLGIVDTRDAITWCGRRAWSEWIFVDATHAIINGAQEGSPLLCSSCSAAIRSALDQGTA